jgi:protein-histidine pros-kinase
VYVSGSVEFLSMIVGAARDAIVAETMDGTVVVWNDAAEELYGYPAAEMVGQRAERLYPPGEAATRRLGDFVGERIRRDGTPIRVHLRAAPITDSTGATVGVATTSWATDASAGHELRTPLNAIIGFTGILLMRLPGPLNDEQEHQLRLVQANAEQLLSQINQLTR